MADIGIADLSVLIVEPSLTQRNIIIKALNNATITEIIEVERGDEALNKLKIGKPDLLMSALYLPDMTGTDLIHEIRSDEEYNQTAFVLISSETRLRHLDPVKQAGTSGILPKPFSDQELSAVLIATLDFVDPSEFELAERDPESLHVLVVDDSNLARKHIMRVLGSMGIKHFTTAENGVEALKIVNQQYFDFIVTDYNMPEMDGKELIDEIRQYSNQSSVPIMMVTSEENNNRLAAVQNAGVSAICDKPFEPATIRDLVQRIMA